MFSDDDNEICPVCDGDCTCDSAPPRPSLKIKLTIPQSMLKRSTIPPRRRRRPPTDQSPIKRKSIFLKPQKSRLSKDKQAAAAISRKIAAAKKQKRRKPTVIDHDEDEDAFPTFLSASALSSLSSTDSDSSSEDAFETDSEIEAEEENFIIADVRDKARVRRELLGDDTQKKRDQNNDWIIRPRKKSVGPSDDEMDVDSDATEDDENDNEDDEDGEEDDEEPDGKGVGRGYVGLATGWSDEESSFDADLFFANLSGSDSSSSTDAEDDVDPSDTAAADLLPNLRQGLENLPFEVTESWDGQIVFTNGIRDGQGVLDIDFEIDAAQFMVASAPTSPSLAAGDSDVEMHMLLSDIDDGGYEEDADGGDGDTTDEELVGEDDLPNERAMRLFTFPLSVSAINPLSTVSPTVSPAPSRLRMRHTRRRTWTHTSTSTTSTPRTRSLVSHTSPKPADILAGRIYWESDDNPDDVGQYCSPSTTKAAGDGPSQGNFIPNTETRNAIIDDTHKGVPSPHPSFRRNNRGKSGRPFPICPLSLLSVPSSSPVADRSSLSEDNNGARSASSSIPPCALTDAFDTPTAKPIELNDVLEPSFLDPDPVERCRSTGASSSGGAGAGAGTSPSISSTSVCAITHASTSASANAPAAATQWWRTPTPRTNVTDYGKVVRQSPFSALLASRSGGGGGGGSSSPLLVAGGRRKKKKRANRMMDISPVILPKDRERDRTPTPTTTTSGHLGLGSGSGSGGKSRKELRRERKLKRKMGMGPVHHHHQYQYAHHNYAQHHHYHRHYPNAKTRGVAGVQRSGGGHAVSSAVPPLSL